MSHLRHLRRIGAVLALAAWLFALACTSAYACQLGTPAPQEDCCATVSLDAACSVHCEFGGQAPAALWPDFTPAVQAAAALWAVTPAPAPILRVANSPHARGAAPPLFRLRN